MQDATDIKQAIQSSDVSDDDVMQMVQTHSNLPGPIVEHIYPKIKDALIMYMQQEDNS